MAPITDTSERWADQKQRTENALANAVTRCEGVERVKASKALAQIGKMANFSCRMYPAAALTYALWMDVEFTKVTRNDDGPFSPPMIAAHAEVEALIQLLWRLRSEGSGR